MSCSESAVRTQVLVADGKKFYWKKNEQLIDLLRDGQIMLSFVDVAQVKEEVEQRLNIKERKPRPKKATKRVRAAAR